MKATKRFILLVSLFVLFVGCGSDDPVTPVTTVIINIEIIPEGIEASWELTGPNEYSKAGAGNIKLTGLAPGGYEISYDFVSEYVTPESEQITLSAGGEHIFRGNYIDSVGTININQDPDVLDDAQWSLTGPQNESGFGDVTFMDMPAGEYTLSWVEVGDLGTPETEMLSLYDGATITFLGIYIDYSITMAQIWANWFVMGSPEDEYGHYSNETEHTVTLTTSFVMSTTEVTNEQYMEMAQWAYDNGYCTATSYSLIDNLDGSTQELLDLDGSCEIAFSDGIFSLRDAGYGINPDHPVIEVTWYGAVAFCDWRSLREGLTRAYNHSIWKCNDHQPYAAEGYRLPTEAEWEYACRAGTTTPFYTGDCLDAGTEANYRGELPYSGCPSGPTEGWTVPVGSYPVTFWNLYDMHGNINEWCNDWYEHDYNGDQTDPAGPASGSNRTLRGGHWAQEARYCRSAFRDDIIPSRSDPNIGFRFVRSVQ
jgi:formylglycine-generating enzyme